jgi:predicted nucleic acid-binding protein
MVLVDSNVLLDIVTDDPVWSPWSSAQIEKFAEDGRSIINGIVYAELSVRFSTPDAVDEILRQVRLTLEEAPRSSLFLAGKVYRQYRASGGTRTGVLPDFFIGAHAAVEGIALLTRDPRRYRTYFPTIKLIAP